MSDDPIRLGDRRYSGPNTIEGVMSWYDQVCADAQRVATTNSILEAEKIGLDLAEIDWLFADAAERAAEARAAFLKVVTGLAHDEGA